MPQTTGSEPFQNPFENLTLKEQYELLTAGSANLPTWPSTQIQQGYCGTHGVDLLRRAYKFIDLLDTDGAFRNGWKGLDYGCGWGRFASVLLSKGSASQLDMCDAWDKTIGIVSPLNYSNRIFKVSELLQNDELEDGKYSFILAFSVFTHLAPSAFEHNLLALMAALQPGGKLYITVRHEEFINHKFKDRVPELTALLQEKHVVFLDSGGDMGTKKVFGDTIVDKAYLEALGGGDWNISYVGQPHSLQHVYSISVKPQ